MSSPNPCHFLIDQIPPVGFVMRIWSSRRGVPRPLRYFLFRIFGGLSGEALVGSGLKCLTGTLGFVCIVCIILCWRPQDTLVKVPSHEIRELSTAGSEV